MIIVLTDSTVTCFFLHGADFDLVGVFVDDEANVLLPFSDSSSAFRDQRQ